VLPTRWHDLFIALGNRVLQYCFYLTGGSVAFRGLENIPKDRVFVVVSNHQSLFDIPLLIWLLRGRNAKFIAKKSLGRGIPSASYVLRSNGHALIDRGNALQATTEIRALAQRINATGGAAVLFPEGTRARDGKLKSFKPGGLKTLLAELGAVSVVPVSIDGAWRIMRFKFLPVPFRVPVACTVHKQIRVEAGDDPIAVSQRCEEVLRTALSAGSL
jgi:1-acyl-sn-glycerol-3-phosphate acyltransferase